MTVRRTRWRVPGARRVELTTVAEGLLRLRGIEPPARGPVDTWGHTPHGFKPIELAKFSVHDLDCKVFLAACEAAEAEERAKGFPRPRA